MQQCLNDTISLQLSIVVPVYNSQDSLRLLVEGLNNELRDYSFEIIFVNDCSADNSLAVLRELAQNNVHVLVVDLARNFGQHSAIMAGLRFASGELVVLMDDDLQHPPSEVLKLLRKLEEGDYDVVYGRYLGKKHHWFRNLGSQFNDKMATLLIKKPSNLYFCSFKVMKAYIVVEIINYCGAYPYIDGLIFRSTTKIGSVEVEHKTRDIGASNYTLKKLVLLWLNMFTNFSILPLRLVTIMGFLMSFVAFVFAVFVFIERFWFTTMPQGWASIMVSIMLMAGVQLASIGLLGEYLGRTYLSINQTPQYVVRGVIGRKKSGPQIR